jgi:phage terminase large subunit
LRTLLIDLPRVIGGAGHSSDAMAIWICQFVGREIRLLDYIEGVG